MNICREDAIKLFFKAIDHDDPYWVDLLQNTNEDWLEFDEDEDLVRWPNQYEIGRALGFSDKEMEKACGLDRPLSEIYN